MFKNRTERTLAKQALAEALKVSVRHINRKGLCEKPLESVQNRAEKAENARKHRENCKKYAQMVVKDEISAKDAAAACGVSLRQLYRYVAKEQADVQ